jgi:hypothetical protein
MTQREYQMVVDRTRKLIGYRRPVKVSVEDLAYGQGYYEDKIIKMPCWIEKYDTAYQIYYVVHELCHCIIGVQHTQLFKVHENTMLGLWNIRIVRKTVYPKKLYVWGVECNNIPSKEKNARIPRITPRKFYTLR